MPCYCRELRRIKSDLAKLRNMKTYATATVTEMENFKDSLEKTANDEDSTFSDVDNRLLKKATKDLYENIDSVSDLQNSVSSQENYLNDLYESYSISDEIYHEEQAAAVAERGVKCLH